MLKEIVEIIKKTIKVKQQRKSDWFIIKKVVDQTNILKKSVKIQKISSKGGFLKSLIGKQANKLQNIKKLIMRKMMIWKVLIMQQKL